MRSGTTLPAGLTGRAGSTNDTLVALLWASVARLTARPVESVLSGSTLFAWLFRESGGIIALPLLLGLFLVAEFWRRKTRAPAWPHLLLPALLAPPLVLCALGASWSGIDRGTEYPTARGVVLFALGATEFYLSILVVRSARRRWPIMLCIVSVALLWTFTSWLGAALSVGADTL